MPSFDRPIPKRVRENGQVLDPSALQHGDLMLVSQKTPGLISRKIQEYQRTLYEEEHAQWHHAVTVIDQIKICEAIMKGVVCREYWDYMTGDYNIKIRRVIGVGERPELACRIAINATAQTGRRYSISNLISILRTRPGELFQQALFNSKGIICSQLYFEACMSSGILLYPEIDPGLITPSHLSSSAMMTDVNVPWIDIAALEAP